METTQSREGILRRIDFIDNLANEVKRADVLTGVGLHSEV